MIVARIIAPAAKLATARQLSEATAAHSLGAVLGLGAVDEDELYAALDLLGRSQSGIEKVLAQRHLKVGVLVLYDVTSSYLEGRHCELAQFGYSGDHRGDRPQIVFGLLCTREGCPVAVEVFEGNLGDPSTLAHQVRKLRLRFRLQRIVLVGDRRMITQARIDADVQPAGFDWITALRAPAIQALAAEGGPLQLSLFDERDMAEITAEDYPGERLIVCRNPELAAERRCKRNELLAATEAELAKVRAMTERKRAPLRAKAEIASRSAPCSIVATWPSTSRSTSPRIASPGRATARPSPPRPRSMASMSSAAIFPATASRLPPSSSPTKASAMPNAASATSSRAISTPVQSIIAGPAACAPTSSCACSPTTSSGTAAPVSVTRPLPEPRLAPTSDKRKCPW